MPSVIYTRCNRVFRNSVPPGCSFPILATGCFGGQAAGSWYLDFTAENNGGCPYDSCAVVLNGRWCLQADEPLIPDLPAYGTTWSAYTGAFWCPPSYARYIFRFFLSRGYDPDTHLTTWTLTLILYEYNFDGTTTPVSGPPIQTWGLTEGGIGLDVACGEAKVLTAGEDSAGCIVPNAVTIYPDCCPPCITGPPDCCCEGASCAFCGSARPVSWVLTDGPGSCWPGYIPWNGLDHPFSEDNYIFLPTTSGCTWILETCLFGVFRCCDTDCLIGEPPGPGLFFPTALEIRLVGTVDAFGNPVLRAYLLPATSQIAPLADDPFGYESCIPTVVCPTQGAECISSPMAVWEKLEFVDCTGPNTLTLVQKSRVLQVDASGYTGGCGAGSYFNVCVPETITVEPA